MNRREGRKISRHRAYQRTYQIMEAITEEGPLPYANLVERLDGLSTRDHVRGIVADAGTWKVLQGLTGDGDLPEGLTEGNGPRTQYVEINRDAGCVVGVNIGRTYFAIGAADPNGRLFSTAGDSRAPKANAPEEVKAQYRAGQIVIYPRDSDGWFLLKNVAAAVESWLEKVDVHEEEVRGITLSLPAPVSTTQSKVLTNSIENGLGNIENIEKHFRLIFGEGRFSKLEKVIVANDADVSARGEVRYGNAYGMKDVVVIHAAYGVGAGIVTDGKVLRTGAGGGAGEIGHCVPRIARDEGVNQGLVPLDPEHGLFACACGCVGHLEAMAGGEAIMKRLVASRDSFASAPPGELAGHLADPNRSVSKTLDVLLGCVEGENRWEPGREAVLDAAHMIGGAAHTIAHLMKPEVIYLCGKLSEAGDPFLEVVEQGFDAPGCLQNYKPQLKLGKASSEFDRRLIMVRGAAMTAVRGTEPLITLEDLQERQEGAWVSGLA
jgi:predicted NBD/HSP70 family sugar kinase